MGYGIKRVDESDIKGVIKEARLAGRDGAGGGGGG